MYCMNCGISGHSFKHCGVPITSYGIILLSFNSNQVLKDKVVNDYSNLSNNINLDNFNNESGISINDPNDIELFCSLKNSIRFLLIRRKHTLGFLEFIRGRYNVDNVDGIIFLFKQMTPDEIKKIKTLSFDDLWDDVWGNKQHKSSYYNEYINSKEKFQKLKNDDTSALKLDFYTDNVIPVWKYAEWGFPKGRRNSKENNLKCAIREFQEESDFEDDDFTILDGINPIEETLIGTNGISYRHVYYLAIAKTDKEAMINDNNKIQIEEVGDIKYMTYEETIKIIRPHHIDRQKIVTQIYIYFINYLISSINQLNSGKIDN